MLPCKVGDTIYELVNSSQTIVEHIVCGLHYTKENRYGKLRDNQYIVTTSRFCDKVRHVNVSNIGKTVFLSRKEAEQACKGR